VKTIIRNSDRTYSACPVLSDSAVRQYLKNGEVPPGASYIEVPPNKIIRSRGVWLTPSYRAHDACRTFLISTDAYEINPDDLGAVRTQIYCYYSENSGVHYLGRINEADSKRGEPKALLPLIEGLHDPLLLSDLQYTGRVIAAS
jgi:hypothetical protein